MLNDNILDNDHVGYESDHETWVKIEQSFLEYVKCHHSLTAWFWVNPLDSLQKAQHLFILIFTLLLSLATSLMVTFSTTVGVWPRFFIILIVNFLSIWRSFLRWCHDKPTQSRYILRSLFYVSISFLVVYLGFCIMIQLNNGYESRMDVAKAVYAWILAYVTSAILELLKLGLYFSFCGCCCPTPWYADCEENNIGERRYINSGASTHGDIEIQDASCMSFLCGRMRNDGFWEVCCFVF